MEKDETIIAEWPKGVELIRLISSRFEGVTVLNLRIFYQAKDGAWRPTKKGMSLSFDRWRQIMPEIVKLLEPVKGG
jgi:Transcriptional Coactivator p15 (PC4)